ncbi:MAG: DUF2550 family protein [Actinomycetaceae bacterium]|nr:DUF2550 family protein [Actinomycetaceae bacterium]
MNSLVLILALLLLFALVVTLVVLVILLIRARSIGHIVGTFECASRPDTSSGWVSGMARFGSRDLQWFRLFGLQFGPQFRMPREDMRVSAPIARPEEIVEVMVESGGQRRYLAMRTEWYNGLVSWVDSGLPRAREDYDL